MKKRIIVVEDDFFISEVLVMILKEEQYRVESFTDNSFLAGLVQDMPGLILLDLWLSGMNGKDICEQLKQDIRFRHIPVIILSAGHNLKQQAEEVCADDSLPKPFEVTSLLLMVAKYMK